MLCVTLLKILEGVFGFWNYKCLWTSQLQYSMSYCVNRVTGIPKSTLEIVITFHKKEGLSICSPQQASKWLFIMTGLLMNMKLPGNTG